MTSDLLSRMTPAERAEWDHLALLNARAEAKRDLLDFVTLVSPMVDERHTIRPDGLPELTNAITDSLSRPVRACFSTPPQAGKTSIVLHGLGWYAWNKPRSSSMYVTYGEETALSKSEIFRAIAQRAGLSPRGPMNKIVLSNGATVRFCFFGGPIEAEPVSGLMVIDDCYKNRDEAGSPARRLLVESVFFGTLVGRWHEFTSVIVIGHRWTMLDLIQIAHARLGWPYKNWPALIDDRGNPATDETLNPRSFWEAMKATALLLEQRRVTCADDPFAWEGEYQGNPQNAGGQLFTGITHYGGKDQPALPTADFKRGGGLDFGYTESTSADHSVAVVLMESEGRWYFEEVLRRQQRMEVFAPELLSLQGEYPGLSWRWRTAQKQEEAIAAVLRGLKINVHTTLAPSDKRVKAQKLAIAWNRGLVLMPDPSAVRKPWYAEVRRVFENFTGAPGGEDDDVDAAGGAFSLLPASAVIDRTVYGSAEWGQQQRTADRLRAQQAASRRAMGQDGYEE